MGDLVGAHRAPPRVPRCRFPRPHSPRPRAAVAGQPVQFTDGSSGATQWFWSFGDGEGSTERNPVHAFGFDGTLTVTETAVNQTGAVSASRTIAVSPPAKLHPQPLPESGGRPRVVTPRGH